MSAITEAMKTLPYFYSSSGANDERIADAEKRLGVTFSRDYREYVAAFGNVSVNGHELTGITDSARLDVVSVTFDERVRNAGIPADLYVIEQTGIDRIVVWQDTRGAIYQTIPGGKPQKIYDTLSEYIAS